MKKTTKHIFLLIALTIFTLTITGCSAQIGDETYEGVKIIWVPFFGLWNWFWNSFTKEFWSFIWSVWELPAAISWIAGVVAVVLGFIFYIIIAVLVLIIELILGIVTGILWFGLAVFNGFSNSSMNFRVNI